MVLPPRGGDRSPDGNFRTSLLAEAAQELRSPPWGPHPSRSQSQSQSLNLTNKNTNTNLILRQFCISFSKPTCDRYRIWPCSKIGFLFHEATGHPPGCSPAFEDRSSQCYIIGTTTKPHCGDLLHHRSMIFTVQHQSAMLK